ncbi:hypothetical protein WH240_12160 [Gluconobacter wancherniae]|uniref:hypothetical protein n=1 Tax=Gluconobacter TaxID=441 RepID=UPI001B8AFC7E|nr:MULTISPECIES: hypothetical protein [Gluconobacter]MBS1039094.1 hypothetical protein [Gluconobacter cerinus]MBS1063960.1 hypothetical protein [Gluconobacter wancherniae]MBS1072736.1 hypothetical protein [Gluconobacter cerinus]MBS1089944.1 hypothetical protein [Gluconobacter wancherniae]MCP1237459.1 hypothetical protein [Gluconobacter kondonii]
MRIHALASIAAVGAMVISSVAIAQVPQRTRGTVVSVGDASAVVRTPMGRVTVALAPDTGFVGAKKASLDDIKSNTFIGTAAVPGADGSLRALEVTIFPESMRGAGEGSYPWDLGKSGSMTNGAVSSMTNGTVAAAVGGSSMTNGTVTGMSDAQGRTIKVTYKGGVQTVALPETIPVVMLEPGEKSLLKAGAKVVVFGPVSGTNVEAKRIIIGEDGVKPPM